ISLNEGWTRIGRTSDSTLGRTRRGSVGGLRLLRQLSFKIPFKDRHELCERLENIVRGHALAKAMRADIAQLAHRVRIGSRPSREWASPDEPLEQVFQRSCSSRFFEAPFANIANDVFQHLAYPRQGHLRVPLGDINCLHNTFAQVLDLPRQTIESAKEILK